MSFLPPLAGGLLLASLAAAAIPVDGHLFAVPRAHLVDDTLFFLPRDTTPGFSALLDPAAPLRRQHTILVQATASTCRPRTPPATTQLASACAAAAARADDPVPDTLRRVYQWPEDRTQWQFRADLPDGTERIFASCSGDDGSAGLCTTLANHDDLVFSLGFGGEDLPRLPALVAEARRLLRAWDQGPPPRR